MHQKHITIIYDDTLRADTTGGYCLRALRDIAEVSHVRPAELGPVAADRNLIVCVDDGLDLAFAPDLHPSAFWVIDTHLDFPRALRRSRGFDAVFVAQKEGAARLVSEGIPVCEWLPLACDSEIHKELDVVKEYDVAFVGNPVTRERVEFLEHVQRSFPNSFISQAPHTQMGEIYSRARIVINHALNNDLNMRVFEAMSCGAMLLTPHLHNNGQEDLFTNRVHLVEYHSAEETLELIDYYLTHDDEREQIAAAGHQEVIAKHTYRHRMEYILNYMNDFIKKTQYQQEQIQALSSASDSDHTTSIHQETSRSNRYFHWPRPDVLALVPTATRVLDVGCAAGVFGAELKRRQQCEVVGIELNPDAAAEAQTRLDRVLTADIETADFTNLGQFDVIVCGDVLEHLRDPAATLIKLHPMLGPEGTFIASVPNVRSIDILQRLAEGGWQYQEAGILDREHLRFFTRRSMEMLLEECGFAVETVHGVPAVGYQGWRDAGRPAGLQAGRLGFTTRSAEEAEEFFIEQWLLVAHPRPVVSYGLTSIILLTYNELAYTQACIESIRRNTAQPYELIVVDNGSADGTRAWLAQQPDIQLIANETNLGFAKGANQGLQTATGVNLLLLNNDTVVTAGWLRRLLTHLHAAPSVGLVGPVSNCVSGPQQIPVPYHHRYYRCGCQWHERGGAQCILAEGGAGSGTRSSRCHHRSADASPLCRSVWLVSSDGEFAGAEVGESGDGHTRLLVLADTR